jgi:hypothetical protein
MNVAGVVYLRQFGHFLLPYPPLASSLWPVPSTGALMGRASSNHQVGIVRPLCAFCASIHLKYRYIST